MGDWVRYSSTMQRVSWIKISLGPGSAVGGKRKKNRHGQKWAPFPHPQVTTRLASLANIFPIWPGFLPFSPNYGAWSQARYNILSSYRNVFIFTQRMHEPKKGSLRHKIYIPVTQSILKRRFFVFKDFYQSLELQTIAKKNLQFHMFFT